VGVDERSTFDWEIVSEKRLKDSILLMNSYKNVAIVIEIENTKDKVE